MNSNFFKKYGIEVIGGHEYENALEVAFERKTLKLCKPINGMNDLGLSKSERKGRSRVVSMFAALFDGTELNSIEDNQLSIGFNPESYFLINKCEYREVFSPILFMQDTRVLGGVYLCPWICGTEEQKKDQLSSLNAKPIKEIVTGMCMFGDSLFGVDQQGALHPLTDARYNMPSDCKLISVFSQDILHPYEISVYKMLDNIVPLIKTISEVPKIVFHLPAPEYVLYGIKRFLYDQMPEPILYEYISVLKDRVKIHLDFINEYAQDNDIDIEISSPLDPLNLFNVESAALQEILAYGKKMKSVFAGGDQVSLSNIEENVSAMLLHRLMAIDPVWSYIKEINEGALDLIAINNYSYCARIAQTARKWEKNEVCILDDAGERPTATHYARDFAVKFGSVLALHWLPPMFVYDNNRNSMYFLGNLKKQVMIALAHGHAEKNFHLIGKIVR